MSDIADPVIDVPHEKTFFGQPRGLANLFGVELWERFSFYGMQGILLLYLYSSVADGGLAIDKAAATSIVGPTAASCTSPRSSERGWPTGSWARSGPCSSRRSW